MANVITSKSWGQQQAFHTARFLFQCPQIFSACQSGRLWSGQLHSDPDYEMKDTEDIFAFIWNNCVLSFHERSRIVKFQWPRLATASFPWNGSKSQMPAVTCESIWQNGPINHLNLLKQKRWSNGEAGSVPVELPLAKIPSDSYMVWK